MGKRSRDMLHELASEELRQEFQRMLRVFETKCVPPRP